MVGTILVWVAFIAAVWATYSNYRLATNKGGSVLVARRSFLVVVGAVLAAAALLKIFILDHHFEYAYVWGYSSKDLPPYLLVTAFWAGQEGSFLFWAFCAVIIGLVLQSFARRNKIEHEVMAVYMLIVSFLLLLLITKSPFKYIWDEHPDQFTRGTVPTDGKGLNPLLQNFWMIIHPPVLFIGFASLAVPFVFAVVALWKKTYSEWISPALPWVMFSAISLGAGLMLGGYWAYGVLGWGGWWGWDPVENSSLLPWITVIVLLHTLIVQKKTGKLLRTNFILAIVSFLLVVYSTFLTRSGILGESSVHSFVDPGSLVYNLLVVWILSMVGLGGLMLKARWNELKSKSVPVGTWTRESFLSYGAVAMALSALVIFVGTSWPIVSNSTVEPSFYDKTNLPVAVILAVLLGLSLFTRWGEEKREEIVRRAAMPFLLAVIGTAVLLVYGLEDWQMLAFAFSSLFVLVANIRLLVVLAKENLKIVGGPIAHIGLAVLFLGIIGSGRYGQKAPASLPLNQTKNVLGYELTYRGAQPVEDGKSQYLINVRKDGESFMLSPVMYTSAYNNSLMRNPDYRSGWTEDFYLEPVSIEKESQAGQNHSLFELKKGDPQVIGEYTVTFEKFDMGTHSAEGMASGGGFAIGAVLTVQKGKNKETVTPVTLYNGNQQPQPKEAKVKDGSIGFEMFGMAVGTNGSPSRIELNVTGLSQQEMPAQTSEVLVVEASVKPFMNFVWLGAGLVVLGFAVALVRRGREVREQRKVNGKNGNGKREATSKISNEIKQREPEVTVLEN